MENRSAFDKSNRSEAARSHHRILSLSINGGFLDGARLEFSDGLNCIIGGRGTGKTTVLEFIRYILGMLPDGSDARPRVKATQSHVRNNLGSGTIILDVDVDLHFNLGLWHSARESYTPIETQGRGVSIGV